MNGPIFLGLFLCGLGVYCAVAPAGKYAEFYGIAGDGSAIRGWMFAQGLRDFTLGTMTFVMLAVDPSALKVFVPLIPMITIGDAVITSRFSKAGAKAAIRNLGGTLMISLLSAWVLFTPL